MNYVESVHWLFQQVPSYQQLGEDAYKDSLHNIIELCNSINNPQDQFKSIHIAGTNGKGSTSHMLASILQESKFKTGLFTSPHLKDFRERCKVNGEVIDEDFVIEFIHQNKDKIQELSASFFEVTTAMAFLYFAKHEVDIAIIETGLGGRLDSTNIIKPELSVITNIALDHTQILGETVHDIALEKGGIIKKEVPVIIGEASEEVEDVFNHIAKSLNAPIYFAQKMIIPEFTTDLQGSYQRLNTRTAIATISVLKEKAWRISDNDIKSGLSNVIKNTGLRGRWEVLGHNPMIVADTAHNPAGIAHVVKQIQSYEYHHLHLVLGFVNDKDVVSILNMFPIDATFYLTEPMNPRRLAIKDLKQIIPSNLKTKYFNNSHEAIAEARKNAQTNDFIFIGGSTFIVSEAL